MKIRILASQFQKDKTVSLSLEKTLDDFNQTVF